MGREQVPGGTFIQTLIVWVVHVCGFANAESRTKVDECRFAEVGLRDDGVEEIPSMRVNKWMQSI